MDPAPEIIVAGYFTTRPDPQRGRPVERDSCAYLGSWYESVVRLGLHGVVLHDGLSPEFVDRAQNERVRFHHVAPLEFNPCDSKWIGLVEVLETSPLEKVFLTDLWDVEVMRDPFQEMAHFPQSLFCGDEPKRLSLPWLRCHVEAIGVAEVTRFFDENADLRLLNSGVLGGEAGAVRGFAEDMERWIRAIGRPDVIADMVVFNYLLYTRYANVFKGGFPVTSEFAKFEKRSDVWFVHK